MHLGCLLIFLLLFGFSIIAAIVKFIGKTVTNLGALAVWVWESFLNLFRIDKKEVINPFTGDSNFDHSRQDKDITYTPTETRPKRYDSSDGEDTPFQDL